MRTLRSGRRAPAHTSLVLTLRLALAPLLLLLLLASAPTTSSAQEPTRDPVPDGEPAAAEESREDHDDDDTATDERERVRVDAPPQDDGARLRTNQRLREIGNQVDTLKEDTFATKSRLLLLRESVLRRSIAGSKIVVVHENDIGAEFELVQVHYGLDRETRWSRGPVTDGSLDGMDATVVIDERLVPGAHLLSVSMVLKGRPWGIFTYMEGYTVTVQASHSFTAEEGIAHEIVVRLTENDGFFTSIEERPTITFEASTQPLDSTAQSVADAR